MKVRKMTERMNVKSHVLMIVAIQNYLDLHPNNWANALNYMATKIAKFEFFHTRSRAPDERVVTFVEQMSNGEVDETVVVEGARYMLEGGTMEEEDARST